MIVEHSRVIDCILNSRGGAGDIIRVVGDVSGFLSTHLQSKGAACRADAEDLHFVFLFAGGPSDRLLYNRNTLLISLEHDDLRDMPVGIIEGQNSGIGVCKGDIRWRIFVAGLDESHPAWGKCLNDYFGLVFRLAGQYHIVAVVIAQRLGNDGGTAGFNDPDGRFVVIGHVGRNSKHFLSGEFTIQHPDAGNLVGDQTAVAQQIVADHIGGRPVNEKRVASQTAGHLSDQFSTGTTDKEPVVTLGAVNFHGFHTGEENIQSGTENAVFSDHKVVVEFGTNHDDGIEAVAAVDVHRCVHRILDEVGTSATADIGTLT